MIDSTTSTLPAGTAPTTDTTAANGTTEATPAEAKKPVPIVVPEPVPYDRFKEINEKAKNLEAENQRLKEVEAKRLEDEKRGKEKQLAAEAKWQELASNRESERDTAVTERDALKAEITSYQTALQKVYDGRVTAVPEMYRPLLSQLPLPERMTWIAENEDKLSTNGKTTPGGIPTTPAPRGAGTLSDEERRKRAAKTF